MAESMAGAAQGAAGKASRPITPQTLCVGKWRGARVLSVDTRNNPERDRELKEHWAGVALERLHQAPRCSDAFHSYNLFGVSRADVTCIRALHVESFERVRCIIAESHLAE